MIASVIMLLVGLGGGTLALYGNRLCTQGHAKAADDYANGRPTATGMRVLDRGFLLAVAGIVVVVIALLTFLFVGPIQ
ncbi:hypothetical protein ACH49M_27970 [Rhodococcus qingshengii]|uniref:Uncharacterized protein n=1 Tax=Rhodococcus erythropolis TaxID=1833 RepID=A0A8I1D4D9_RHOER|nr:MULTISPECIES: hypothetical protein [Rhodococcus erythropolis group]MBH5141137.1 hypothetical protein [Rhodococcus erythropolis]UGQ55204.1 hypothetical protein LRL17_30350 [Rhodococcus qingshengii]